MLQRCAMLQMAALAVLSLLMASLYMQLQGLRVEFRHRGALILDLRQRLLKTEALLVQRRRVQETLLRPPVSAGGIEGRVQLLEADAQQSNELLLSFINSKAPPEVRHHYVYTSATVNDLTAMDQSNPLLVDYIKRKLFVPPVTRFRLTKYPAKDLSRGNGEVLKHIFKNKKNGFFIECGALDGLWLSNTFYFERLLGWTGVLIEADAFNFNQLIKKNRNVLAMPTCLSRNTRPELVAFTFGREGYSKIDTHTPVSTETDNVLCMPIFSILLAINRTSIDLFSLDIEGHELDVLRTIPWDDVDIKVLIVEFLNIAEGKAALEKFMVNKGYEIFPSTADEKAAGKWAEDDHIFVKKGIGLNEY